MAEITLSGNTWSVGDVAQIAPEHDDVFGGVAYYRVPYEALERVGRAVWVHDVGREAAEGEP
jgi:hypothetical protein